MRARLTTWLHQLDIWDRRASAAVAAGSRPHRQQAVQIGAHSGDLWLWTLLTLLWWPRMTPAQRREWGGGMGGAAAATYLLKQLIRRRRPQTAAGLYGGGADVYSFPSGHAARWGVILVWAARGGVRLLAPAMLLALWTGLSRVRLGIHTLGDVGVGLLLGVTLARLLRRWERG